MLTRTLFTKEHDLFREEVRDFITKEIQPYYHQWEERGKTPKELWEKAGEHKLLCPSVPKKFGGMERDFLYN